MRDLNDRMKQSISIAASQQENLNSAVSISKRQLVELKQTQEISAGQLDVLKKQWEILSRTPDAWMTAYCEPVQYDTTHRLSAFVPPREKIRSETLWTNGKGEVTCQILIENGGKANLTNAAARLKIEALLVGQTSNPHPPFTISYSLEDERRVQRLPPVISAVTDQHSTIVLMEGQTIIPSSGLWNLQLRLTVPQEIRVMNLIWQFGGDEQNFPDDQVSVTVNRLPEEPR